MFANYCLHKILYCNLLTHFTRHLCEDDSIYLTVFFSPSHLLPLNFLMFWKPLGLYSEECCTLNSQ